MSDININKVVLKKEGNRYIFDPRGNVDLSNYYTKLETDSKYALTSHTHSIANITNLQSTLDGKSNTNHTHSNYATTTALNEVRNLANGKLANIDNICTNTSCKRKTLQDNIVTAVEEKEAKQAKTNQE